MQTPLPRLLRVFQVSRRCMSTRSGSTKLTTIPILKGSSGRLAWTAPMGAVASVLCGAILLKAEEEKRSRSRLFTLEELGDMCESGRIVVALQGGLYDMSDFSGHPGGVGRLQMAAGNDLEVYWKVYTQHNRGHIIEHMRPYKIGEVSSEDMATITANTVYDDSVYADNPPNYPDLLTNTRYPYNAEARLSDLRDSYITPIGKHFVRNHCAVPNLDPEEYRLTVEGVGVTETVFTLEDLKTKFPKVDVTSVIQCNGNRREDFHYVDGKTPAFGPPHWVAGAMGNSTWSGCRLRDVLRASGMDVDAISLRTKEAPALATHVGLLAYDHDEIGNQYCCSFPFDKAIDPFGDVILAYEMNGETIPRPYGFPIRAIVPGHAGARNCKFLEKVTITNNACKEDANWKQYAVHAPDVPLRKIAEFEKYKPELIMDPAVQEMPVQSLITHPSPNEMVAAAKEGCKSITVKGIAWGGGGSGVNRVDVSLDNGENFTRADLLEKEVKQRRRSEWGWVFFEKTIPFPPELQKKLEAGENVDVVLTSKTFNSAWNVQPENVNYNAHGCCVNHWYRVPVTLNPSIKESVKADEGEFANKPSGGKFTRPFLNMQSPEELRRREAIGS